MIINLTYLYVKNKKFLSFPLKIVFALVQVYPPADLVASVLTFFLQLLSLVHSKPMTDSRQIYPVTRIHSVLFLLDTVQND